jgi:pyridoxal phosphate enzyme (YggS family)
MPDQEWYQKKLEALVGKLPPGVHLLIVSKNRSAEEIMAYYQAGQRDFGENRVQELLEKSQVLKLRCPHIRWHMIGHLQTNKINQLFSVPHLVAIHSVHDQHLLDKLIKAEDRLSTPVDIFLQMNTSLEEEKSGFETYTDLRMAAEGLQGAKNLRFKGLMTMGKIRTDHFEADARACFQLLNVEKEKLESEFNVQLETSMGMSQDYHIALEEKSNWIRLGTMMFELSGT